MYGTQRYGEFLKIIMVIYICICDDNKYKDDDDDDGDNIIFKNWKIISPLCLIIYISLICM